ncbi:unnamed protein product [Ixodes pacificus]
MKRVYTPFHTQYATLSEPLARARGFIYGFVCARTRANDQRDQTPCSHQQLLQRCALSMKKRISQSNIRILGILYGSTSFSGETKPSFRAHLSAVHTWYTAYAHLQMPT